MDKENGAEQIYRSYRNYLVTVAAMHERGEVTDADLVAAAQLFLDSHRSVVNAREQTR